MKKIFRNITALLLSVIVVLSGAILPGTVSSLQDCWLYKQSETHMITQLQTSKHVSSIVNALSVLAEKNGSILLRDSPYKSKEQVLDAAQEIVLYLTSQHLFPPISQPDSQTDLCLFLSVSETEGFTSAIIWQLNWITEDGYVCTMQLEGETKKLLGIQTYFPSGLISPPDNLPEKIMDVKERWLEFCQEYYEEDNFSLEEKNNTETSIRLKLQQDNAVKNINIPLRITESSFEFNIRCHLYPNSMLY